MFYVAYDRATKAYVGTFDELPFDPETHPDLCLRNYEGNEMWYIFTTEGQFKAMCPYIPNFEDLASRGQVAVGSLEEFPNVNKIELTPNFSVGIATDLPEDRDTVRTSVRKRLDDEAFLKYIGGFSSLASGENLWYDSDPYDQQFLEGLYRRAFEPDFETYQRIEGLAPGLMPVRARGYSTAPPESKFVVYLGKDALIMLGRDLERHMRDVKMSLWAKQALVEEYYQANDIEGMKLVTLF